MPGSKSNIGFGSACIRKIKLNKTILPHIDPIYATSAYLFESPEQAMKLFDDRDKGYIYSRWGNPTIELTELKIAELETHSLNIEARAQLFSSGMAAISSVILSCVKSGEKFLTQYQLYGTTDQLMESLLPEWKINNVRCDLKDLNEVERITKSDKQIKLLYIESPSNPLIEIFDIKQLVAIAKRYKVRVAVDNTFSTPYLQQPLKFGADFSIHSTTKFLNGHGNALGGAVIGIDLKFMKKEIWEKVKFLGGNSNAFDAWLLLQGIRTLEIRMQRHCENSMRIAEFLNQHKAIRTVNFAGLKDHPQHDLAKKQMRDFGAMLSFELKGGLKSGIQLMNKVKLCSLVTSLGTVDTLIQHPASMTHVNVAKGRRIKMGITDGLIRMSVGIENAEDIIEDLDTALQK